METQESILEEVGDAKKFSASLRQIMTQATAMLDLKRSELKRHEAAIKELEVEIEEIEGLVSFSTGAAPKQRRGKSRKVYEPLPHKNTMVSIFKNHPEKWLDAENIAALTGIDPTPLNISRVKKFLWRVSAEIGALHRESGKFRWNSAFVGNLTFREA